ncbi:Uncharacterised protein [Mycobacteroides abscessus subsp. massiliense]|uniref:hypothetical protein n=1 Tax=Mycobacteroides abscessus TaxID=36809 RepID=UPI0009A8B6A7|nr:hypothetical protein [Mycobacteroides abscessus]SKS09223.1 Uncharacterised protein [Mycobacteroides abscessus subsp. massiliense]
MTPELIQAIGGAFGVGLAGWQALTSRKVRDLETRLQAVEKERDEFRTKLRAAVRHIREWMSWATHHVPGAPPPPLPPELLDEV